MTLAERVAIVGAGPRSAYALERLAALGAHYSVPLPTVDVIAPGSETGPGENYQAGQPDYFRLNVASSSVHAWDVEEPASGPSLDQWRERFHPDSLPDLFPARSLVGNYLAHVGSTVRALVPGARIDAKITGITQSNSHFILDVHQEDSSFTASYDEVLLAVGHARAWSGVLDQQWSSVLPLTQVYPANNLLRCRDEICGQGDPLVLVRGAALTGLDASLCLTQPGGVNVRVLLVSRSGKLMSPKTDPAVLDSAGLHSAGQADLLAETGVISLQKPETDVAFVLAGTATEILFRALGADTSHSQASSLIHETMQSMFTPPTEQPKQWLRHRLAMANGQADPDGAWALGQAWRLLYPALVARQRMLAHLNGPPLGWSDFHRWSGELERLAFGPPPVSAAKLLALMDEEQVQVISSTAPIEHLAADKGASLVVDAVLAPPGIKGIEDPLIARLTSNGLLAPAKYGRGVRVDHDATAINADGQRLAGFAAVGRITEDVVVGNDTLVRSLHPELDQWARRVLGINTDEKKRRIND